MRAEPGPPFTHTAGLARHYLTGLSVCKRAAQAGGRLVFYLEWSCTPSPRCPRPPKCASVALKYS